MHSKALYKVAIIAIIFAFLFTSNSQAQEHRRAQPAFPIGAGEKMIIITGSTGSSGTEAHMVFGAGNSSLFGHRIVLPVGTTLKRFLVDAADTNGGFGGILNFSLVRYSNADGTTKVVLRTFNSGGIDSTGITDFKQIVGNPLSHSMLQGWSYWVLVQPSGGQGADELALSVIKIIYEP